MKSTAETIDVTVNYAKFAAMKATFRTIDNAFDIVLRDIFMHSDQLDAYAEDLEVEAERLDIDVINALDKKA